MVAARSAQGTSFLVRRALLSALLAGGLLVGLFAMHDAAPHAGREAGGTVPAELVSVDHHSVSDAQAPAETAEPAGCAHCGDDAALVMLCALTILLSVVVFTPPGRRVLALGALARVGVRVRDVVCTPLLPPSLSVLCVSRT